MSGDGSFPDLERMLTNAAEKVQSLYDKVQRLVEEKQRREIEEQRLSAEKQHRLALTEKQQRLAEKQQRWAEELEIKVEQLIQKAQKQEFQGKEQGENENDAITIAKTKSIVVNRQFIDIEGALTEGAGGCITFQQNGGFTTNCQASTPGHVQSEKERVYEESKKRERSLSPSSCPDSDSSPVKC